VAGSGASNVSISVDPDLDHGYVVAWPPIGRPRGDDVDLNDLSSRRRLVYQLVGEPITQLGHELIERGHHGEVGPLAVVFSGGGWGYVAVTRHAVRGAGSYGVDAIRHVGCRLDR